MTLSRVESPHGPCSCHRALRTHARDRRYRPFGQLAFRVERTILRHDYVQARIPEWFAPLEDPVNHDDFVTAMMSEIRRALKWSIPPPMLLVVYEAARGNFTHDWLVAFVRRARGSPRSAGERDRGRP